MLEQKYIKRFWTKVDKGDANSGCWVWCAGKHGHGYGMFYTGRKIKKGQAEFAHRVAYEIANGVFDYSLHVLHTCDNTSCVNPTHLRLGTHEENMKDRDSKGRNKPRIIYSQDVIDAILSAHPCLKHLEVSALLGVPAPYISRLRRGVCTGRGKAKYPNEYYKQHKNRKLGENK